MPTYVYRCADCDHLFEEFLLKIPKDDEIIDVECPKCKSTSVARDFSAEGSGFILKGHGWFRDGYSTPKKPNIDTITSSTDE